MSTITCPKCGHKQILAAECLKCGIIFDKLREKKQKITRDQRIDELQKAARPGSGGIGPVHTRRGPKPAGHLTRNTHGLEGKTRRFRDELLHLSVRIVLTYVFFTGLFWLTKGAWFLYEETPMGGMYRTYFIKKAHFTTDLMSLNPLTASFEITLLALLSCLLIGLGSQLLAITRNLYLPMAPVLRVIIWGVLCTLFTVYLIQDYFSVPLDSRPAFWVGFIPTLTLFPASFSITAYIFPELISFIPGKRRIFDQ